MTNKEMCKLKTKKTLEQLRNQPDINFGSSEEGLKRALKYNNLINGLEVIVIKFKDEYCLANCGEKDVEKIRDAYYILEQDEYFGCYINEYERFKKDWENGECGGEIGMMFSDDEVEIIEKLREG
ncbi:TPA: hypothetical protein KOZ01_001366 [Clostridioides difficile]|uniref:hypothetical protein n=1 Tax=Clostridioides difficile TaxID=1496 RepID=UPI00093C66BE|nr:hypothetical protein [Clostridioides difficile]EGT4175436.1 hypothetical protein [Clostridioides difficile]EGT4190734.1 hypothetical protein [Clostridioides difficile]MBF8987590.1 hypothetical protein [Clostridioides difficile]MBH7646884.1 hypothetical protein [Clostridioides difficile]MBY1517618.1 hypothetical protein [Clostridioides difficile]